MEYSLFQAVFNIITMDSKIFTSKSVRVDYRMNAKSRVKKQMKSSNQSM